MFVKRAEAANESSQMMKSPLSTAAMMSEATFSQEGNLDLSSSKGRSKPWMRLVRGVFVFCSRTNPGETKSAGKAQWMLYVEAGQL